ncbi:MAG: inorganic diphosphatase [Patescibacteria group bacterium]
MHLVHDIKPGTAEEMNVIIEIAKGSGNKYEVNKESGIIALDRVLHTSQEFPFDYGFVPQTLWHDGDPLDVIVFTTYPLMPGILVKVRPVAIANINDSGEEDSKIIAVPVKDPRWSDVKDLTDLNKHTLREIAHFYATYKNLQDKEVIVKGFSGSKEAKEAFEEGVKLYANKK